MSIQETSLRVPAPSGPIRNGSSQSKALLGMTAFFCFVLTFVACLVQNLSHSALDQSWAFDSSHYLNSAQMLFTLWQQLLQHGFHGIHSNLLKPLAADLLLDGPVLPFVGSLVLLVTNKALTFAQAPLFIVLQSCFDACAAAALCLTATRLTGSRSWGLLAGILWALYPPAVIAAGKFMTEIASVLLLVCLVFVLSFAVDPAQRKTYVSVGFSLTAGLITAGLWLLKGALAPATALIILVALAYGRSFKRRAVLTSALLTGLVISLLPWLIFTKTVTGQVQIMPQRAPVLNAVFGLDPDLDGWGTLAPMSPWQKTLGEKDGLLPSCIAMVAASPYESINLVLRKSTRLWEAPANDYHRKFLRVMPPIVQGWWHDIIVVSGLLGMLIFFGTAFTQMEVALPVRFIGTASTVAIGTHLIFAIFSANSRYGFSAMPFFILFAVYGIARFSAQRVVVQPVLALSCAAALVISLRHGLMEFFAAGTSDPRVVLALELAGCLLLLALSFRFAARAIQLLHPQRCVPQTGKAVLSATFLALLIPLLANHISERTIREWTATLHPGQAACRRIDLPAGAAGSRMRSWAYVVFDGDARSSTALVRVNGVAILEKPESISASDRQGTVDDFQKLFAKMLRQRPETFRQWRLVSVPVSLLSDDGVNSISLEPRGPGSMSLYGDFPGWSKAVTLPSLTYFSATKLCNEPAPLDPRPAAVLNRPLAADVCWRHDSTGDYRDLSKSPGRQYGRYRLLLLTGYARDKNGHPDIEATGHRLW